MNDRLFPGPWVALGQPQRQRLLFLELSVLIIKATQCLQRKSGKKVGASHCLKGKLNKQTPAQRLSYFSLLHRKPGEPIPWDLGYLQPWKAWGMFFLTAGAYFSNSLTSCYVNSRGYILELSGEGGEMGRGIPSSSGHQAIPRKCVRLRPSTKILNPSSLNVKGG